MRYCLQYLTDRRQILDKIIELHHEVKYYDQDVLNCLYYAKVKIADWLIYNLQCPDYEKYASNQLKNASILHYIGNRKPWHWIAKRTEQENYYWNNRISFRKRDILRKFLTLFMHYMCYIVAITRRRIIKTNKQ